MRFLLTIVCAAFLLAGCTGADAPGETPPASSVTEPSTPTRTTPDPTTTPDLDASPSAAATTTGEQSAGSDDAVLAWKALVAERLGDYEEAAADWEDATCSSIAAAEGAVDCQTRLYTNGLIAQTLDTVVNGALKESGPTYAGELPTELLPYAEDLAAAAETASQAAGAVDCPGESCLGPAFEFEMAFEDLGNALTKMSAVLPQ